MRRSILVLGAGAWGTAIANLLADNKKSNLYLWALEKEVVDQINNRNVNDTYLSNIKLNKNIKAINDFKGVIAKYVFVAVPSQYVFIIVKKYLKQIPKNDKIKPIFILCSKGFDLKSKKLLSEVLKSLCSLKNMVVLSGPSFARLVAEKKPTALTLAYKNIDTANKVKNLLNNKNFRIYLNRDIIGVQVNGAIKNILAIAAGITDGLGYGENARAAIICRGICEIEKISKTFGGKKTSTLSLSGIGDILLTCTSESSRNYSFGFSLGRGKNKNEILGNKNTITEGLENSKALYLIKKKYNLDTPILDSVYKILIKKHSITNVVNELLERPLRNE